MSFVHHIELQNFLNAPRTYFKTHLASYSAVKVKKIEDDEQRVNKRSTKDCAKLGEVYSKKCAAVVKRY